MAITYPRSIPAFAKAIRCDFNPVYVTTQGRTRGGGVQSVETADPYWDLVTWETPSLSPAQLAELAAWLATLRGGNKTFLAHNPFRQWPTAYASEAAVLALLRATGDAFNGTFEITAFPNSGYSIESSGSAAPRAPTGMTLTVGDMIGVYSSTRRSLHRVTETVTSASNGRFVDLTSTLISVEPPVKTNLFTPAVGTGAVMANIIRPTAEMVLLKDRVSCIATVTPGTASFGGISKVA